MIRWRDHGVVGNVTKTDETERAAERVTRGQLVIQGATVAMEAHFHFFKPFDQAAQTCPPGKSRILERNWRMEVEIWECWGGGREGEKCLYQSVTDWQLTPALAVATGNWPELRRSWPAVCGDPSLRLQHVQTHIDRDGEKFSIQQ